MKINFIKLLAFASFVVVGNVRADVVGLQTNTNSTLPMPVSLSNGTTFLEFNFNTTGLSGAKFTGISFLDLGSSSLTFTASLLKFNGLTYATQASQSGLTYNAPGSTISLGSVASSGLDHDSLYKMRFVSEQSFSVWYSKTSNGVITNSMTDWIVGSTFNTRNQGGNIGNGPAFTLYTSVPEPGTIILTGSALVAGGIGAYIKRRRKKLAEADAADYAAESK